MRKYRLDFSKGVNSIGDKGIIGPGWASVLDNVDLRSGSPRPLGNITPSLETVTAGTKCIFNRRGLWSYSSSYRDYAYEFLAGRDRVYYTEEGQSPKKVLDGVTVNLGTPSPKLPPIVSPAEYLLPVVSVTENVGGGSIQQSATRSYRVSAETDDGIQPASTPVLATASANSVANIIAWSRVAGAMRYHIYAGNGSDEQEITSVSSSYVTFTDTGTLGGSGKYASEFDNVAPLSYVYTFVREIQTVQDESGPSPISQFVSYRSGRTLICDPVADGFMTQTDTVGIAASALVLTDTMTNFSPVTVTSATYYTLSGKVKFVVSASLGLAYLDKARFMLDDPAWLGVDKEVVPDITDATGKTFFVEAASVPSVITGSVYPCKTKIHCHTFASTGYVPQVDDVMYLSFSGGGYSATKGTYKATIVDSQTIYVSLFTTNNGGTPNLAVSDGIAVGANSYALVFTPGNGGIKFRNFYRTGDASGFSLVKQLPVSESTFIDTLSVSNLGDEPDSHYVENGVSVIYSPPPVGMMQITSHYGMLFGIDGYTVRWTPIGRPDAWPAVFSLSFPYKPVALSPFSQGMTVLCEDAIYRIDGNSPTGLSQGKTLAEDGCVAPYSVQRTHAGLVYLSKRGLMLFNGTTAECITDRRIDGSVFLGTSHETTAIDYWIKPSLMTYNYANLAASDGVIGSINEAIEYRATDSIEGINTNIRSFCYLGKYYMYWPETNNYEANTMFCVDLQVPGYPITSMSVKPLDAFVTSNGECYFLLDHFPTSTDTTSIANWDAFKTSQCGMTASFSPTTVASLGLGLWESNQTEKIPYHIRTGMNSMDEPSTRKKFWDVRLYDAGTTGTLHVRIYIDGRYVCDGRAVTVPGPNKTRQVNIPNGMNTGYAIDVEFAGDVSFRCIEFNYDHVSDSK